MELGFLTILPLLIMVASVIITKRVLESMIIPIILVFILKDGSGFLGGFTDSFYNVMFEGTYPWILLMLSLFGILIQLLLESGAINGFKRVALQRIKTEKGALFFTWLLGILLCIDDYINDLAIGPSVRNICDKYRIPREGIGFVVVSMGIPACSLLPITAMAVFVSGVMQDMGISAEGAGMTTEYAKVIPFLVYPVVIIIIALLFSLEILPKIGPMKRLFAESKLAPPELTAAPSAEEEKDGCLYDFFIPVLVLVAIMIATSDLVVAVIIAIAVCFFLYIPRKKMTVEAFFKHFYEGVHSMVDILIILLMIFIFVDGLNGIGISDYVVTIAEPILIGWAIPALCFIIVSLLAFGGVDYWAVMLLMSPIAFPLAQAFGVSPYLTMAAIVSGAVCGGTSCFFGEQLLMCSHAVQKKSTELAVAGLPYTAIAFTITAVTYLILGFAL